MKLIVAVVQDKDRRKVTDALLEAGYKFTNIASTGGFLREGNVTYLIGVPPDQVDAVLELIGKHSKTREQFVNVFPPTIEPIGTCMPSPVKVTVGGAVIFVVDVEQSKTL
ncbi:MAG: cyclic-di-AMP receptor [Armatimonadota bacterium]|nr:MAG: cyclic-di-AMP receptor [Armatimonadota bacterium]